VEVGEPHDCNAPERPVVVRSDRFRWRGAAVARRLAAYLLAVLVVRPAAGRTVVMVRFAHVLATAFLLHGFMLLCVHWHWVGVSGHRCGLGAGKRRRCDQRNHLQIS
jgi:hypothetical protein